MECNSTALLAAAARRLDVAGMHAALEAGANAASWEYDGEGYTQPIAFHAIALLDDIQQCMPDRDARQLGALRLLAQGGGLSARNATHCLRRAAELCGPEVMQCLIDAGADLHSRYCDAFLALHMVKHAAVARVLIAAGADVNGCDLFYKRPLHYCAAPDKEYGYVDIARVLLAAGADVHAVGSDGHSALHDAAASWAPRPSIVRVFLEAGADPTMTARAPAGQTPLQLALHCLSDAVRYMSLQRSGARAGFHPIVRHWRNVVRLLARATAWRRRRHLLLAVRDRHTGASGAASAASSSAHGAAGEAAAQ